MEILTPKQVAEKLQIGQKRVYDLLNSGELKGFRLGSKISNNGDFDRRPWRILESDLNNYISSR